MTEQRWQQPGQHFVNGRWISCCEEGEDDCPCTCHDDHATTEDGTR